MIKKVGLYFGSFNPIHIGHLALANYLCETNEVDEIWFVVSPLNPFKQNDRLLDDITRLRLVKLAIGDYPRFKASDVEFHLSEPSYTIHTLDALRRTYTEIQFSLIIGSDNWKGFHLWKEADRILNEIPILIYPRPGYPLSISELPTSVHLLLEAPIFGVSATFIRESLTQGKDIRYFLHPSVYEEIKCKGLYLGTKG
jgi:nicotinate-nucleotide adenylyltransferase